MSPKSDPGNDGYFWSFSSNFNDGTPSGGGWYAGLQSQGDNPTGKIALFSVFGGIDGVSPGYDNHPGVVISSSELGQKFYSVRIPFSWVQDGSYTFRIVRYSTPSGAWWATYVKSSVTNLERLVGRIQVPDNWGKLKSNAGVFSEWYGTSDTACSSSRYVATTFSNFMANGDPALHPTNLTTSQKAFNYYDCKNNAAITTNPTTIAQQMGINNSHSTLLLNVHGRLSTMTFRVDRAISDCGTTFSGPRSCQSNSKSGSIENLGTSSKPLSIYPDASKLPADYIFTGWDGLCNGVGVLTTCKVVLPANQAKILNANFDYRSRLYIGIDGVSKAPLSVQGGSLGSCSGKVTAPLTCRSGYDSRQRIAGLGNSTGSIKVYPGAVRGYHFVKWTGSCVSKDGFGGCGVRVDPKGYNQINAVYTYN